MSQFEKLAYDDVISSVDSGGLETDLGFGIKTSDSIDEDVVSKASINKTRDDAGVVDKTVAFWNNIVNNNIISRAADYLEYDVGNGDEDDSFKENIRSNKEHFNELLNIYEITDPTQRIELGKSKNLKEFTNVAQMFKEQNNKSKEVNKILGETGQFASGMIGQVATPALGAGLVLGRLASMQQKSAAVLLGVDVGVIAAEEVSDTIFDRERDLVESLPVIALSSILNFGAFKYGQHQANKFTDNVDEIADSSGITNALDEEFGLNITDGSVITRKAIGDKLDPEIITRSTEEQLIDFDTMITKERNDIDALKSTQTKDNRAEIMTAIRDKEDTIKQLRKDKDARIVKEEVELVIRKQASAEKDFMELKAKADKTRPNFIKQKELMNRQKSLMIWKDISENVSGYISKLKTDIKNMAELSEAGVKLPKYYRDTLKAEIKSVFEVGSKYAKKRMAGIGIEESLIKKLDDIEFKIDNNGRFIGEPPITISRTEDGTGAVLSVIDKEGKKHKLNNKIIPLGLALAILPTFAMAGGLTDSDGDEHTVRDVILAMALLAGGYKLGMPKVRDGSAKEALSSFSRKAVGLVSVSRRKTETTTIAEHSEDVLREANMAWTDASSVFKSNPTADSFMKKMLFDSSKPDGLTADVEVHTLVFSNSSKLTQAENKNWLAYAKEKGMHKARANSNAMEKNSLREKFNFEATEHMEGKLSDSPAVIAYAKEVKEINDSLFDLLIDRGVTGFKTEKKIDNYVMKSINHGFRDTLAGLRNNNMTDVVDDITEKLAVMIQKGVREKPISYEDSLKTAKEYISGIEHGKPSRYIDDDDPISALANAMDAQSVSRNSINDFIDKFGAKSSRVKDRLSMDMKAWGENLHFTIDGKDVEFGLSDLYERDLSSITDKYIKVMAGNSGLAVAGHKNLSSVRASIDSITGKNAELLKDEADNVVKLLFGGSLYNGNTIAEKMIESAKNLAMIPAMPLVSVAMAPEILKTVARIAVNNTARQEALNSIASIFGKDKESFLYKQMSKTMGFATSMKRHNETGRFMMDNNPMEGSKSSFVAGTRTLRDIAFKTFQLPRVSDWIAQVNMTANVDVLRQILDGEKSLKPVMKQRFGITDRTFKLLKGKLEKTKDGNVKDFDNSKWDLDAQDEFKHVMFSMQQRYAQEAALGMSQLWSKKSAFANSIGSLLGFPLTAVKNHAITDTRLMLDKDLAGLTSQMAWFAGGYVASVLRAELSGKDVEPREHAMRAISSMPIFGGIGVGKSLITGDTVVNNAVGGMVDNITGLMTSFDSEGVLGD